jgi:hypothetical protein
MGVGAEREGKTRRKDIETNSRFDDSRIFLNISYIRAGFSRHAEAV